MRARCGRFYNEMDGMGLKPGFILEGLILKLLSKEPMHGYEIFTRIEEYFFEIPSFRGLVMRGVGYRILRMMEEAGLITSEWDVSVGPARRVYKITDAGIKALDIFIKNLETLKNTMEEFVNFLKKEV